MSTGRGNGKSPLGACIVLLILFLVQEHGKQLFSIASSQKQAAIVFNDAKAMVRANKTLDGLAECHSRSITVPRTYSSYEPLTSRPKKHGYRPNLVIADEVHEYKNHELLDALRTAQGKRIEALIAYLTTAGVFDDASVCWQLYDYAKRVISGEVRNAAFLPVIYEVEIDEDWRLESNWSKANPNLGVTVRLDFLRNEYQQAVAIPAYQNVFRRLYCNQWVEQVTRWMDMAKWDAAGGPAASKDMQSKPYIAGLDLGECDDLTALATIWKQAGRIKVAMRFWLPEGAIDKNPLYRVWAAQGLLTVTDSVTHYDRVQQQVVALRHQGQLVRLLVDRYQAGQMTAELVGTYGQDGNGKDRVQYYGQGFASMTGPIRDLERLILERQVDGLDNPILRWMAQNADAKQGDNLAIKLVKPRDGNKKIDGLVALVMGLGALHELNEPPSFTATRGLRRL